MRQHPLAKWHSGLFKSSCGQPSGNQWQNIGSIYVLATFIARYCSIDPWWQFHSRIGKRLPLSSYGQIFSNGHIKSHVHFHADICNGFWDTWLKGTSTDNADCPTSSLYSIIWVLRTQCITAYCRTTTDGAIKWRQHRHRGVLQCAERSFWPLFLENCPSLRLRQCHLIPAWTWTHGEISGQRKQPAFSPARPLPHS